MNLEKALEMKKRLDIIAASSERGVDVNIRRSGAGYNVEVVPKDDKLLCVNFYVMAAGSDQIATSVFVRNGKPYLHIIGT